MPSTVIVSDGGTGSSSSSSDWIDRLLPIAVLGVAAYLVYTLLTGQGTTSGSTLGATPSGSGGGGGGNGQQQQQQGTSTPGQPGTATLASLINTPGTYINPPVSNVPQYGTGQGNLFVNTGPGSPNNLYPLGNVITTSTDLSTAQQNTVLANLARNTAGITNAWYQSPTITNPNNYGINSAGSPQSNLSAGVRHCPCTAALRASGKCGPNDDWYIC